LSGAAPAGDRTFAAQCFTKYYQPEYVHCQGEAFIEAQLRCTLSHPSADGHKIRHAPLQHLLVVPASHSQSAAVHLLAAGRYQKCVLAQGGRSATPRDARLQGCLCIDRLPRCHNKSLYLCRIRASQIGLWHVALVIAIKSICSATGNCKKEHELFCRCTRYTRHREGHFAAADYFSFGTVCAARSMP
jgi:hypothetical protein